MAAASNIYQEPNPLECNICYNVFSEDHCPRILPCSHSFCGPCIDGLISAQKKECPLCREAFVAKSSEDFMIIRDLLDAAKHLSSMHLRSRTSSSAPRKTILDFTKDFQENLIRTRIIQMLEGMKLSSEKTLRDIDQDNKELMKKLDIMQQEQLNMKESERKLGLIPDSTSSGPTIGEAGQILLGIEKTVIEIKQLLQENDRRRDNMRQDALTDTMKDLGKIIEELEGGDSVVKITVTDLRSPHGRLRGDAQRETFVVMTFEGKLRLAPVKTESNNQLYINHLEEGRLPPRCFVIELESLIPGGGCPSPSPPISSPLPRGFLDLACGPSTPLGRVVIRVTVNGLKGCNFLHMCAGGIGGASYAPSRVSGVGSKGGAGEWIGMGLYCSPGGVGGGGGGPSSIRAVLPLTRKEDWRRERENVAYEEMPLKAGDVGGYISHERASLFCIITRDDPSLGGRNCFGMVEEGLEVLKAAISKYEDITQVKVANCGLIL